MTRWLVSFVAVFASTVALAQKSPEDALKTMTVADGLQVELFAAEPMLINPTSMDIDPKGNVWVTEAVNYRCHLRNRPLYRNEGDRIQVLIDTNGDGKADEAKTFYQGKELIAPIGICIAPYADGKGSKIFVCQSPDILVFEDKDGDLKADGPPAKFLTGFQGIDHDHGVHGINIGPDGKLYFTVGDQGVRNLQATDGKGPKFTSNTTDIQKGTVWRCDMDGKNLELIAHNFRNNYECCVNSFGEVWLSDNDDDGNQQTRICFVMPGGNYGYGPRGKGESHWHEEQPGIVHKALRTGFGSPTGITFYEGSLLPEKYRGQLLHTDAGPRELRCFHIKPKGAGYELDKTVMLTSSDNWFRPSDVCVAPDGSVFVADWYDPGVGGHGMGDWTKGRIYRVTPKGHAGYKVPEVKLDSKEGLLAAFGSPCLATRAMVIDHVRAMPTQTAFESVIHAAGKQKDDAWLQARSVWESAEAIKRAGDPSVTSGISMAAGRESDERFDVLGIRARNTVFRAYPTDLIGGGTAFRREQALLIRNAAVPAAKETFYHLAQFYDGQDLFYRAALNIACGTDPARRDAILADFPKHFPEWNDKVADLVWELRPKSMMPKLDAMLADAKLTGPQKARIVDILAASEDAKAGESMLKLLSSDAAPEVKERAITNLKLFLPNKWSKLAAGDGIKFAIAQLLDNPENRTVGLQLIAAAGLASAVKDVAAIAEAKKVPTAVRMEAIRTLGQVPGLPAIAALRACLADATLAAEAVRALAAHVGTGQKLTPQGQVAITYIQEVILAADTSTDLKAVAVDALAGTRPGTDWLLDVKEQNKLPTELVAVAGKLLRNSPFQAQRNRALILFPAAAKLDPKKLIPAELAKRAAGNIEKGKQVMAASLAGNAQCMKCHTVRGLGGQVGPDLSMIGKKGSVENLFESLLQPSKAIADQYVQQQIVTAAGLSITGLPVAETNADVTLRDANGKDNVIKKDDIETRKAIKTSIMPDDIAAALTEEELIDLVAYLQTLQTAALTPEAWYIAGPFDSPKGNAGLNMAYLDEKAAFNAEAKFKTKGSEIGWRGVRSNSTGYIDLAAFHGPTGEKSVSYLYQEIESPADQDAEVLLGTDDGAKLFLNGAEVFSNVSTKAASPGRDKVAVKLKKGKNALLLKIANGNHPHGFYLTVLAAQELKLLK